MKPASWKQGEMLERGPVLPASEADSVPLRVTRNCLWNRCRYCTLYRGQPSAPRTEQEIDAEIDHLARELPAERSRRVFLQDADVLTLPVPFLSRILRRLRAAMSDLGRVTAFTSTRTLVCLAGATGSLEMLRAAGLSKLLVGVESGSDRVLEIMNKGCTGEEHVRGCRGAMDAGFEVGCYIMPGLGGRALTADHAEASGRVLTAIGPHQVLLRTLYCHPESRLEQMRQRGEFELLEPSEMVEELLAFLRGISGTTAELESSYNGNLLPDLEGRIDARFADFERLCRRFLSLPRSIQDAYAVARRLGVVDSFGAASAAPEALAAFVPLSEELRARAGGRLAVGLGSPLPRQAGANHPV